jgi:hypothetical protein
MQHPCSMRNVRVAVISGLVAAVLLVGGVVAAATQASRTSDDEATQPAATSAEAADPPAWARAHKHHATGPPGHPDKAWKESWHAMTPAQREQRMTELTRTHRQGMRQWQECVAAARDNAAERKACEKPLPPGLAKKS